jgi:hypothetical protein
VHRSEHQNENVGKGKSSNHPQEESYHQRSPRDLNSMDHGFDDDQDVDELVCIHNHAAAAAVA